MLQYQKMVVIVALLGAVTASQARQNADPFVPGGPCTRGRVHVDGNAVLSDWGTQLRGACWWQYGIFQRSELAGVKAAGLNTVHLYAAEIWEDNNASSDHRHTDSIVEWCRQESLYVVMTCAGGAKQGPDLMFKKARASWSFYAPRYANQTHVVYELMNEPCLATYHCDEVVMQGINDLYTLVRELAPESHIMVMSHSNLKGGMNSLWEDIERLGDQIDWRNASYAFHGYGTTGAFQEQASKELGEKGIAMTCTEFPFSEAGSLAGAYERAGISYMWFEACWGGSRTPGNIKSYIGKVGLTWQPDFGTWPQQHVEQVAVWAEPPISRARAGQAPVPVMRQVLRDGAFDGDVRAVYDIRGRLLHSIEAAEGARASSCAPRVGNQVFLFRY